ncbi:glycosyltransferase family 4 protein [Pseudomonas sp. GD03842]|uniref:glycosyltransferase family 4 protein n=1 Tax=Pseudomonas sp. GD03842 TaxID=2975385 RepID=UPI0024499BFA|nr:glycosyltransferase family 1 protein [Pseudomonas sp. GD03842]MDH0748688.1 glycosyltransferase family 4 protein [Pseudomonas sp. GD03842]
MRVGLDVRPATGFPNSGIGRQNVALEDAFRAHPEVQLQVFSVGPYDHPVRRIAHCPRWATPLDGIHRLPERLKFEACFLPGALRDAEVELYLANLNMGLPIGRKPAGMRYVLQLHDLFQLTLNNAHGSKIKAMIYGQTDRLSIAYSVKVADRIWTPSQFTAEETVRLFPQARDKVRVLPNLVEGFTSTPAQLDTPLPERYWLCVGTREPRKNMPWFVEAWQIARRQFPKTPALVLVGGPDGLSTAQRELPGLHILRGIGDGQLHQVYRQAERLWHPSYGEGFGLPVVEALGVGTPVAVASGSSLDEVTPADSPRFSPHDQSALIRLMGVLSTAEPEDPAPLKAWAERFGVEAYRRRFNELLEELR